MSIRGMLRRTVPCAFVVYAILLLLLPSAPVSAAQSSSTCSYGCAPGYFFSNCTASCVQCSAGFYCKGNLTMPLPCGAGTFSTLNGQKNNKTCTPCAAGYWSIEGATSCTACPALTYSTPKGGGCKKCPDGYVTTTSGGTCKFCAQGSFASNVTGLCEPCSASYACPSRTRDKEKICPAGTYSNRGDGYCRECDPGFACPATAGDCTGATARQKYACAPGTYSPGNQTTCTACPAMHYCPNTKSAKVVPCPKGYYSLGGTVNCTICPTGFVCNATNGYPVKCNAGEASDGYSCKPCPAGYSCADGGKQDKCPPGTYSALGALICSMCPEGYSCANPRVAPVRCNVGFYSGGGIVPKCKACNGTSGIAVYANVTASAVCKVCPPGSYCPNSYENPIPCPKGYAASSGKFKCQTCSSLVRSVATYTPSAGADTCTTCPAGYRCPFANADPRPCSPGTYSLGGQWNCTLCPKGFGCPSTTLPPSACAIGTYASGGFKACVQCPANNMCPSTAADPKPCDVAKGYYAPAGSKICLQCPPGASCVFNALSNNVTLTTCSSGYYRPPGSSVCKPCPAGRMCPSSTDQPIMCPRGSYAMVGSPTCYICPAGKHCMNMTSPTNCPPGSFSRQGDGNCFKCPSGFACPAPWQEPILCPLGTFAEGSATNCTACPRGFECPSTSKFSGEARMCRKGWYSIGYQTECTPCPAGFECPSRYHAYRRPCERGYYSSMGQDNCTMCHAGYACPSTNRDFSPPVPCLPGTYSTGGQAECTICAAGYACPYVTRAIVLTCQNGTFTAPGQAQCTPCTAGYYCPTTAVQASQPTFGPLGVGRQVPCGPGQYAPAGSFVCTNCPNGFICNSPTAPNGGRTACAPGFFTAQGSNYAAVAATNCVACPAGQDCSVAGSSPGSCSFGTYSTTSGCVTCPAGYACPTPDFQPIPCAAGQYSTTGSTQCANCQAGYLCDAQSTSPTPVGKGCPKGSYCPQGTPYAILCPAGTYGVADKATTASDGCASCRGGYYCPMGTTDRTTMIICAEGHYCPPASSYPTPCPAGTHSTALQALSRATCLTCPEGYFCPAGSSGHGKNPCPPGFYCPPGTGSGFENACPVGTFSGDSRLTTVTQCEQCIKGHSCPTTGLTAPLPCAAGTYQPDAGASMCIECEAGWSCPRTAMITYLTSPCSPGYYCPKGTALPTTNPCPAGSYTFRTNLQASSECEVCWRGYFCPAGTGSSPSSPQPCSSGHYCPGVPSNGEGKHYYVSTYAGQAAATSTQFPCPPGTYTTATDLYAPEQCTPCPAGSYCSGGGTAVTGTCGAGYFCPTKSFTATQVPCAAGTYSSATGLSTQAQCKDCQPGYYCDAASTAPVQCPPGSYSQYNRTTAAGPSGNPTSGQCLTCPAGYFCVPGSVTPKACPAGQYSPPNAGGCITCEAGRYCPQVGTAADQKERLFLCPAGLYCSAGLDRIPAAEYDACPSGHYCPLGVTTPTPCVPGTYNPSKGRASLTQCQLCTAGYFCSVTGAVNVTGECDAGFYCPAGSLSATQEPCPARYYRSIPRGESADFCGVCPRGFYCPIGTSAPLSCPRGYYCVTGTDTPQPCPIGTFGNTTELKSQDECSSCTAGYYCDGLGLSHPTGLCDPGYFCISRAFTSAPPGLPTGGLCPKGGYCPPGSSFPTACAEGTFNNNTGGSTQQDCVACTPGYYCSGSNLPFPTGPCSAGYYCTGGAALPTQFRTPAGHYTLPGAPAPEECPLGTFNPSPAQGSCLACIVGYYCPQRAMVNYLPCPKGGYCPAASVSPKACVIGTYQPETRRQNVSNCIPCTPGKYCSSPNASSVSGDCQPGFYCKRGCINAQCSQYVLNFGIANNAPVNPGLENQVGGACPWGSYCPNGTAVPVPCPAGTINDALQGDAKLTACKPCPPGKYCSQTGMSNNLSPPKRPQDCQAGYYCPGAIPGTIYGCQDATCATYHSQTCSLSAIGCWGTTNTDLSSSSPAPRLCPTGFYCPAGSANPTVCPLLPDGRSTYADARGRTACSLCPAGFYCDPTDITTLQVPVACPKGKYCPKGTTALIPNCPIGSWSDETHLVNKSQCKRCPAGRYCPLTGRSTVFESAMPFCFGGFYCTSGAIDGIGRWGVLGGLGGPCPVGYYCPNGTTHNTSYPCPPGTFKPTIMGTSVTSCQACTPGKYCAGTANSAVTNDCARGYYCPRGCSDQYCTNKACTVGITPFNEGLSGGPCPKGFYCPAASIVPTPCPNGEYQDRVGSWTCTGCPAGYYCNRGDRAPRDCGPGYYCPPRTSIYTRKSCPKGTLQNTLHASNITDCILCPPGFYCPNAAMNTTKFKCMKGYFCTSGAKSANAQLGPLGGVGGPCPVGHYCPVGTTTNVSQPCPPGTYNAQDRGQNISACVRCKPGFYCDSWAASKVAGPCADGYYCPTACEDPQCSNKPCRGNCAHPSPYESPPYASGGICPRGSYCAQKVVGGVTVGAAAPTACPAGYYSPDSGAAACTVCPEGGWCASGSATPSGCPSGNYCPKGTKTANQYPCPPGTFSPYTNNTNFTQCALCSPGQYCSTSGLSVTTGPCLAGYFCTAGAAKADGTLGTRGGSSGPCPAGYYCPAGTKGRFDNPCPVGTYQSLLRMTNKSACAKCSPGYYCPTPALTAATLPCRAGYYCPRGCSDDTCSNMPCGSNCAAPYLLGGICPKGYICPGTATRGQVLPLSCPAGTYSPSLGRSSCIPCTAGFYCAATTITPLPCPLGRYCPTGSTPKTNVCPVGSFNDQTGRQNLTDCTLCKAGVYCASKGNSSYTAPCFPGYWCSEGAKDGKGNRGPLGGEGGPCPPGHYCPAGTRTPKEFACQPGTYQRRYYASNASSCLACPAGYYCKNFGMANVTGPCRSGFSCPPGCSDDTCSNKCRSNCTLGKGGPCPLGYTCAQSTTTTVTVTEKGPTTIVGAILPKPCPAGKYTPTIGSSTCVLCPSGYYCLAGNLQPKPLLCPPGHYCPPGTGLIPPSCPPGSYSAVSGLNASTACWLCPSGRYCPNSAMTTPGGLCAAGFYCTGGAKDPYGRKGANGGHDTPFPVDSLGRNVCPAGHYCNVGSTTPLRCAGGTYNPSTGGYNASVACRKCDAGKYCEGTGLSKPTGPCIAGFYCPRGCEDKRCFSSVCRGLPGGQCPAGKYCPNGTAVAISCAEGTYAPVPGATKCLPCPIGMYCPAGSSAGVKCPIGHYCPKGTLSSAIPKCPVGTFNNISGQTNSSGCKRCSPGAACTVAGLVQPDQWCQAGYYCLSGAKATTGQTGPLGGDGGICPAGYYCPPRTGSPYQCQAGTFNKFKGGMNATACRLCTAGKYCAGNALTTETGTCFAGFICSPGSRDPAPAGGACPKGYYCLAGASIATACPEGTYNPTRNGTSKAVCLTCTPGYFCKAGSAIPTGLCSPGYYCPGGNNYSKPVNTFCPKGSFCPAGSPAPLPCDAGMFCGKTHLQIPSGGCAPGYYCTGGSTTATPTGTGGNICPAGNYCPKNSTHPVLCPPGTYNPSTLGPTSLSCWLCIAGRYCPTPGSTTATSLCQAGYYCPAGQSTATPANFICPEGHYCPAGSPAPVRCLSGTYQDQLGQTTCKTCPDGFYCDTKSLCPGTNHSMPKSCVPGHYCPSGTRFANEHPCPAGTYSNATGLILPTQCVKCDAGHYCPVPGTTVVSNLLCDPGFYCIAGASTKNPTDNVTGAECPNGNYCPQGSSSPTPCPVGTYSPNRGLKTLGDCSTCPPGKYCANPGLLAPTGSCAAGFYCPPGQVTPDALPCPFGMACPAGSGAAKQCLSGTYALNEGNTICTPCLAGKFCDHTLPCFRCNGTKTQAHCNHNYTCPRACPLGHYCPQGTKFGSQYKCPAGRYGSEADLRSVSDCRLCPAGQYCPYAGMSTLNSLACQAGYWCKNGSSVPNPHDGVSGQICPAGHYCPAGTPHPMECPSGTYNPRTGSWNITACLKCLPGKACTAPALTAPDASCAAGYYCPGGQMVNNPLKFLCPAAFYCPAGSSAPTLCPSGKYTETKGQTVCQPCPAGFYCNQNQRCDLFNASMPRECPVGHYCPSGTMYAKEYPCPIGTHNNRTGIMNVGNCTACPPGKACTTTGLSFDLPDCHDGFFCIRGANTTSPTDGVTGMPCPAGSYCPTGVTAPLLCPPSTYSGAKGLKNATQCAICPSGKYCASAGLNAPTGDCAAGYYCPPGQTTDSPAGYNCTGGKYCPAGSSLPTNCPAGTYNEITVTGKKACDPCPSRYFCNLVEQQLSPYSLPGDYVRPVVCPKGYFCPQGTASKFDFPCPTKTYGNTTGLGSAADCNKCTPGYYCLGPGAVSETGPCEAGYFCRRNSNMSEPAAPWVDPNDAGRCTSGHYCPKGSRQGIPCPPGTYYGGTGARNKTTCNKCFPGHYCQTVGNTDGNGQGLCKPGYYCPGGDTSDQNPERKCPPGTFCLAGSPAPSPCRGGTYNTDPIQSACTICPRFKYCPIGTVTPKDCFARHVCPPGTAYPRVCPNGTYAHPLATEMDEFSKCVPCPAGKFCTNGTISGPCAGGYYCVSGNSVPTPDWLTDGPLPAGNGTKRGGLCPLGHYCPPGAPLKLPCTNQTVGFSEGLERSEQCEACKPGFYCIETSVLPIDCPKGHYCPGHTGTISGTGLVPCPRGTFNDLVRATDRSWCRPCKEGYYCPIEAMTSPSMFPTPPGYYSAVGQAEPYPCPAGTYSAKSNGTAANPTACLTCPIGHYCGPQASTFNMTCPEGTYCPAGSAYPFHCPGGHYCPRRTPDPVACPEGYYCPPLSVFPLLCWNGTYCPSKTEIPLLCPNGYVSRNDTVLRTTQFEACLACPPGSWSSNTLYCEPCSAGHVCYGATTTATPLDNTTERGEICPEGNYCPTGSSVATPCPPGRYNNRTGGRTINACLNCQSNFYNPFYGQTTCIRCGKSATSKPGSSACDCIGAYRDFQETDGSCRCQPQYVFYTEGQKLSEEDSAFNCQPIIYSRCQPGTFRSATGDCVSEGNEAVCEMCPNKKGKIDPQIGICACDEIQSEEEVCNEKCRGEANRIFVDLANKEIVLHNPVTGFEERINVTNASMLGDYRCGNSQKTCDVKMLQLDSTGAKGVYNPTTSMFLKSTGAPESSAAAARRQLLQSSDSENPKTIVNPIVCVNNGESVMWDVSDPSRQHYPVYYKDSLLNSNPNFDYTLFRELEYKLRAPNLAVNSFIFPFTQAGIYVFYDNANPYVITIIRVTEFNEKCRDAPFMAVTEGSTNKMGVDREKSILLAPDWILIGVLVAGLFLVTAGIMGGLWHFRRQTWGMVGSALPRYRSLGQELISDKGDAGEFASKGTNLRKKQLLANGEERLPVPAGSSRPITLRLDIAFNDFDATEFVAIIAEEASVSIENVLVLSLTSGSTIVRFVITACDNAQQAANLLINCIAQPTSEIHTKLPILAFDAAGQDDLSHAQHPAFSMAQLEDEFWDYERQIDLEGFNVRTLYDKLEDQTIHIVSQLGNQRDDVLLLCDKILVETEALKDMFLKVKLDIDDRNRKEREILEIRDQKLRDGQVEFDLPEDLKATLTSFLDSFFQKNLALIAQNFQHTTDESVTRIHETQVVRVEVNNGPVVVTHDHRTQKRPGTAAEEPISAPAELENVADYTDMFNKTQTHRRRVPVDPTEFPREMKDDSDLEEDERMSRAAKREQCLNLKLNRARRAIDRATMPQGLDELPPIEGVRSAEDVSRFATERKAWQQARRAERTSAENDVPHHLLDDKSLSTSERLERAKKREEYLFDKFRNLREALSNVQIPPTMQDDPTLPTKEREARAAKRAHFLQQKLNKARRARAEALLPSELRSDTDLDEEELQARREAREKVISEIMAKAPTAPSLPPTDEPGLPSNHAANRRKAIDETLAKRADMTANAVEELSVEAGASDRSDLDTVEQDRRRDKREEVIVRARRGGALAKKGAGSPLASAKSGAFTMVKTEFPLPTEERNKVPAEYADDSDLDEEERRNRKELRMAYNQGKAAKFDQETPADENAPGASAAERRHAVEVNQAFRRGQTIANGANPIELTEQATKVRTAITDYQRDPETKKALEAGRKQQMAAVMPEEYRPEDKRILRNAFISGRRAASVGAVPMELTPSNAELFEKGKQSALAVKADGLVADEHRGVFAMGANVEKARELADLIEVEEATGNQAHANELRQAIAKGRGAAQLLSVPEELAENQVQREAFQRGADGLEVTVAIRNDRAAMAAYQKGREAKNQADSVLEDWRDDVPLLPAQEVARRRQLQAAFKQALLGQTAEYRIEELQEATAEDPKRKSALTQAFEAGRKAQKQADAIPRELDEAIDAAQGQTAATRERAINARAAFVRGREAAHLSAAIAEELPEGADPAARKNIHLVVQKGMKMQRDLDAVPTEMLDDPALPQNERDRRAKLRAALATGKMAHDATNLASVMSLRTSTSMSFAQSPSKTDSAALKTEESGATAGVVDQAAHKKLLRDHQHAFKQLKEKQRIDMSAALEEIEEENIHAAKVTDQQLTEQFATERKRLQEKQVFELMAANPATHDELKKQHAKDLESLRSSQEEARKEAQEKIIKRAQAKREKMKEVIEKKSMNELRLLKTIQNNQEQEFVRLQQEAAADKARGDLSREEELKIQKEQLLQKLQAREKRLKAKASKDREILEQQLTEAAEVQRNTLEGVLKDREDMLVRRAEDLVKRGVIEPKELEEEVTRIHSAIAKEREQKLNTLSGTLQTDRMSAEKALAERLGIEKSKALTEASVEIDQLIKAQREAEMQAAGAADADETKIAPEAQAAIQMMVQQQEQRRQLEEDLDRQRSKEAEKLLANDSAAAEEAQRQIAKKEAERGQKLTEKQKREIFEECARNAARMDSAMTDEQRRQADENKKKLEEKRRRKEQELNRRHREDMQRELQRQAEAEKAKEQALKAKIQAKPIELDEDAKREEAEMSAKAARVIADMERKHKEEKRMLEAQLQADLLKMQDRELQKLQQEHQRRKLDLTSQHSARESMQMKEEEKQAIMKQHAEETERLQQAMDIEMRNQKDKIAAQLEARKARKRADLEHKQKDDYLKTVERENQAKEEFTRAIKLEAEKKVIDDTVRKQNIAPEKATDIAQVVMADRHREELRNLATRQSARRDAELARFDSALAAKIESLTATVNAEIDKAIAMNPSDAARIRAEGRPKLEGRIQELKQHFDLERQDFVEELEVELVEEQMQLKLQHWNEVSEACGMASPNAVLNKYRAKIARRGGDQMEKELLAFKNAKEKEQEAVNERLAREKAEFEAKMQQDEARRRQEQEEAFKAQEREMLKKLEAEKAAREKKLLEMRRAAPQGMSKEQMDKMHEKVLQEFREDEERVKRSMDEEQTRQQQYLQDQLKRKRDRLDRKREAMEKSLRVVEPSATAAPIITTTPATGLSQETINQVIAGVTQGQRTTSTTEQKSSSSKSQFTVSPSMTGAGAPPSGAALDAWAASVVDQLQRSALMEKVIKIERMLESQVRHGLVSYYVDSRDREIKTCEGKLEPVDVAQLSDAQFLVYFFANTVRENIIKSGVSLPSTKIGIARALPHATSSASAFRNSYHYDLARRTLFIRDTRLTTIGEFCVVMMHGLAHIKAATQAAEDGDSANLAWNDANPNFLKDFYGMLECCTEEMFFLRLPKQKASRPQVPEGSRAYRPESIMSSESLNTIQSELKRISPSGREAYLKTYLQM